MSHRPVSIERLAWIAHHVTVEARHGPAIASLRLLAVLTRTVQVRLRAPTGTRLVLTSFSRTSPRHVMRNAGYVSSSQNGGEIAGQNISAAQNTDNRQAAGSYLAAA